MFIDKCFGPSNVLNKIVTLLCFQTDYWGLSKRFLDYQIRFLHFTIMNIESLSFFSIYINLKMISKIHLSYTVRKDYFYNISDIIKSDLITIMIKYFLPEIYKQKNSSSIIYLRSHFSTPLTATHSSNSRKVLSSFNKWVNPNVI